MTFCVFFTIAALYNLDIDQMDVKIAFLYNLIDYFFYIEIPKETKTDTNRGMVYKLLKVLASNSSHFSGTKNSQTFCCRNLECYE